VLQAYTRLVGRVYFAKNPKERERYVEALRRTLVESRAGRVCDGDLERRVLDGVLDHYFEKLLTAYWGFDRMRGLLTTRVEMVHHDILDGALRDGRGVILATAHFGAVEFLPAALAFRGYPVTMVVRYRTPRLKMTLEDLARQAGLELLDAEEGGILMRALGALRRGRIFITELDELASWKPSPDKVMNLFGRRVQLDRSVELLQRRTGAPTLLGLMERIARRQYHLVIEAPQEHRAAPTKLGPDAQLLKRLEHYIYDHPDHWYIWKDLRHLGQLPAA
jgi:KDO2-lipid IV(A) lauroyltransferase